MTDRRSIPLFCLLFSLVTAPPTNAQLGQLYTLPYNTTDGVSYTSTDPATLLLTIIVPVSMSYFNLLSGLSVSVNQQRLQLQPGHNYLSVAPNTTVFPPIISDPVLRTQFTSFPLTCLFSQQVVSAGNTTTSYPLVLGFPALIASLNTTALNFTLLPNPSQMGQRCMLLFQDLLLSPTGSPANYTLITNFTAMIANTTLLQNTMFQRIYANNLQFVMNSASLNAAVQVSALSPSQSVLFYSYCVDSAVAKSFAIEVSRAISDGQKGYLSLGDFQRTGNVSLLHRLVRRPTMSVKYSANVVSWRDDAGSAQLTSYNYDYYQRLFGNVPDTRTVFAPVDLGAPTQLPLAAGLTYLVNIRAAILPNKGQTDSDYKQSSLDLLSLDLGYRVVSLNSVTSDGSKRSWLLTACLLITSAVVVWALFVYFYFLGRFLKNQRAKQQTYDKYFKRPAKQLPGSAGSLKTTLGSGQLDRLNVQIEESANSSVNLKTTLADATFNKPKRRPEVHINVFKEGIDTPKRLDSPTQDQRSNGPTQFTFHAVTLDSEESQYRQSARHLSRAPESARQNTDNDSPQTRMKVSQRDLGLLPENANDLTFKKSVSEPSVKEDPGTSVTESDIEN